MKTNADNHERHVAMREARTGLVTLREAILAGCDGPHLRLLRFGAANQVRALELADATVATSAMRRELAELSRLVDDADPRQCAQESGLLPGGEPANDDEDEHGRGCACAMCTELAELAEQATELADSLHQLRQHLGHVLLGDADTAAHIAGKLEHWFGLPTPLQQNGAKR